MRLLFRAQKDALYFIVAILLLFLFFVLPRPAKIENTVYQGKIDISKLNLSDVVPLSGEWQALESYPDNKGKPTEKYAVLPLLWKNPFGYAAYALRLEGLALGTAYALRLPYQSTSFRLSVDGQEAFISGQPTLEPKSGQPAYRTGVLILPKGKDSVELRLEVANWDHRRGGPFQIIFFGTEEVVRRYDLWAVLVDVAALVICSLIGGMFLFNAMLRRDSALLFLGLLCLSLGASAFFSTAEVLVFRAFPNFSWYLYEKICYLTTYLIPLCLFLSARSLFGSLSLKYTYAVILPLSLIYLIIAVTPVSFYTRLNVIFQMYSLLVYAVVFVLCTRGVSRRLPYAKLQFTGFLIFFAITLSNILFTNNRLYFGQYLPLSFISSFVKLSMLERRYLDLASYAAIVLLMYLFSLALNRDAAKRVLIDEGSTIETATPSVKFITQSIQTETRAADASFSPVSIRERALASGLTTREIEILLLVLNGKRNQDICKTLFISLSTVKTHLSRIFRKTETNSRAELFALFRENGNVFTTDD